MIAILKLVHDYWRAFVVFFGLVLGSLASLAIWKGATRVSLGTAKRIAKSERKANELEAELGYVAAREKLEEQHDAAVVGLRTRIGAEYEELRRGDLQTLARALVAMEDDLL